MPENKVNLEELTLNALRERLIKKNCDVYHAEIAYMEAKLEQDAIHKIIQVREREEELRRDMKR